MRTAALLLLAGCRIGQSGTAIDSAGEPGADSSQPGETDSASGEESADPPVQISNISAQVSEDIATVVTVQWTTDVATTSHVTYGTDLSLTTPLTEEGTEHQAILLGLTANTEHSYQVIAGDSGSSTSEILRVTTDPLPNDLPDFTVTGDEHTGWLSMGITSAIEAAVILNPDGEVVWYHFLPLSDLDVDDNLDVVRARLSLDGQSMLYNASGSMATAVTDESVILRVSLDGSKTEIITVPLLAHDFVELPDGTLTAIAVEYGVHEGQSLEGDKLVEIAPDGTQTMVWNSWDCFDPALHTGGTAKEGWTHGNALDYDAEDDAYILGMRSLSSIAKIDRATNTCSWVLGGDAASINYTEGTSAFVHQHQFDWTGDGIVVFDNDGLGGSTSRVIEYSIDLDTNHATEVWSYTADPSLFCFALGDVERLADSETLVTWSTSGQIDRVDSSGNVLWQANTGLGYAIGFVQVVDDLYLGR